LAATLQNRHAEARALFERLLSLRNDVGLLAEEYDPHARRQVGNFPRAFSHLALIETALNLHEVGSAQRRKPGSPPLATSMRSVLGEGVLE
jgi:GH15 family glucan-1,4-alpha-glucosidase